jgi:hypothetical protein
MNGYIKQEALPFILGRIDTRIHKELPLKLEELVSQAIDADLAFMHNSGVLDENGNTGTTYYDDDDAFEYMLDTLVSNNKLGADAAMKVASLLDDYMDAQQAFLEEKGLVDWD